MNTVLTITYETKSVTEAVASVQVTLTGPSGVVSSQSLSPGTPSVTYTSLAPGDYSVTAVASGAGGTPATPPGGDPYPPAAFTFTVKPSELTGQIPMSLTVSFTDAVPSAVSL